MRSDCFWLALAVSAVPLGGGGSRALAQTAVPAGDFQWQALGARTYDGNCAGCHQRSGHGIAGGFPPLAGHAPDVLAKDGRAFMARLVLFGMTGAIAVDGTQYNGNMPSWADSLKDDEIAAVIDYALTAWDNDKRLPKDFKPIVPADIAAARADNLTPEQVYAMREQGAPHSGMPPRRLRRSRKNRPNAATPPMRTTASIATAPISTMASSAVRRSRACRSRATGTPPMWRRSSAS